MQSLTTEQKQELVQIINEEFGVGMALDDFTEALLSLLEDVAGFLERVQSLLPVQATIKPAVALPPVTPSAPLQSKEQPRPATEKISDKQTTMILNLIKRKKLTAEQVKALLLDKFGVTDGRLLDKKQASQLISQLLA